MKQDNTIFDLTDFSQKLQNKGNEIYYNTYIKTLEFAQKIEKKGGRTYFVGGSTRDIIMGIVPKDFDIEVHGVTSQIIENIAEKLGKISKVGKSFGILKLFIGDGIDIDISIPRYDSKTGSGHRGFEVKMNPNMGIIEATKRRDFTINSISLDVVSSELFDPYGGKEDITNKILKITHSETFPDDPLRILRAIQFIARFDLSLDRDSQKIMQDMFPSLRELPKERIGEEYRKLLFKSKNPSKGLHIAHELGIHNYIQKELSQDNNTLESGFTYIDTAADYIHTQKLTEENKHILMLGVLCINIPHNRIKQFLLSLDTPLVIINKIFQLLSYIQIPKEYYESEQNGERVTDGIIRKLSLDLFPATIEQLASISHIYENKTSYGNSLLKRAKSIDVASKKPTDILTGKQLIELGFTPGTGMGEIITCANRLRDEEELSRGEIIERITKEYKNDTI